jgi:hypothetical protein
MRINILLELRDLEIVIPEKVGVHLDPTVPVHLSNAHGDVIGSMAAGSVKLRLLCVKVKVEQRLG